MLSISLLLAACAASSTSTGVPQGNTTPITSETLKTTYAGDATYYDATGEGSCGGDPVSDLHVAALAAPSWNAAAFCGACADVKGPTGKHTFVRIVDMCPECLNASLDMGRPAFSDLDELSVGRVPITWRLANCPVTGPLNYFVVSGSSQYWIGIRVRNHRVPVASLELEVGGAFVKLERKQWNDFVLPSGTKTDGAFRVRATSWAGEVLVDTLPGPRASTTFQGAQNFSPM